MVETLEAYADFKMGRYDAARPKWRALAEKGNVQGMLNLANMLLAGQGGAADPAEALHWYRRAAAQGDAAAMLALSRAYAEGEGTAPDSDQAVRWLVAAAEHGSTTAQRRLALRLRAAGEGEGSRRWLERAARGGDAEARSALARLEGVKPEIDPALAARAHDFLSDLVDAANTRDTDWLLSALSHDAKIEVALPGQTQLQRMDRPAYRALWQAAFDGAARYNLTRAWIELDESDGVITARSVLHEYIVGDETRKITLDETLTMAAVGKGFRIDGIVLLLKE